MSGKAFQFHMVFCGRPLIRVSFVATDQWAPPKHLMEGFSPDTKLRSSVAKIKRNLKMTVFQEVGIYRFKITQPNLMILVSFSSAEDASSNDVKTMTFLASKVLKIHSSAFWGHPV